MTCIKSLREEPQMIDSGKALRNKVLFWTQEEIFLDGKQKSSPHFRHVLDIDEE